MKKIIPYLFPVIGYVGIVAAAIFLSGCSTLIPGYDNDISDDTRDALEGVTALDLWEIIYPILNGFQYGNVDEAVNDSQAADAVLVERWLKARKLAGDLEELPEKPAPGE